MSWGILDKGSKELARSFGSIMDDVERGYNWREEGDGEVNFPHAETEGYKTIWAVNVPEEEIGGNARVNNISEAYAVFLVLDNPTIPSDAEREITIGAKLEESTYESKRSAYDNGGTADKAKTLRRLLSTDIEKEIEPDGMLKGWGTEKHYWWNER